MIWLAVALVVGVVVVGWVTVAADQRAAAHIRQQALRSASEHLLDVRPQDDMRLERYLQAVEARNRRLP